MNGCRVASYDSGDVSSLSWTSIRDALFGAYAGLPYDLAPLRILGLERRREFLRRARAALDAGSEKSLFHIPLIEHASDLRIQAMKNRGQRLRGCHREINATAFISGQTGLG